MHDRYFISIGAGIEQIYGMNTVKNMGYKVIAFDKDINAIGKNTADIFYNIDIKDRETIYKIVKDYNIKAVIPSPIGRLITTVGYINDKLNLIGPNEQICTLLRDKNAVNSFLKNNGFNYPEEYTINDIEDIRYPVIIKPQFGSGSRDVKIVYNREELLEYAKNYNQNSFYGKYIINEFIDGKEYSLDAVVINSKVEFLHIRDKILTKSPYRQELQYISPANISAYTYEKIYNTLSKFVSSLGIKNSIINSDIIVNTTSFDERIYIIDIAARSGGFNTISKIIPVTYGQNLIENWIKYIITGKFSFPQKVITNVLLQHFHFEECYFKILPDMNDLIKKYNIVEINSFLQKNVRYGKIRDCSDMYNRGYYILSGDSIDKLKADNQEILSIFEKGVIYE